MSEAVWLSRKTGLRVFGGGRAHTEIGSGDKGIALHINMKYAVVFFSNPLHNGNAVSMDAFLQLRRDKAILRASQAQRVAGIFTQEAEKISFLSYLQRNLPLFLGQESTSLQRVV